MATVTWLGGTSGDISVGANWSGGSFPGTGDTALWNANATNPPSSGTAANAVTNLVITDAVTQSMGTASSAPVWKDISGYTKIANRAPANWFSCSGSTVAGPVNLETPSGSTNYLTAGTITTVIGNNNRVDIGASCIVTNAKSNGAEWIVATNGTAITNFKGTARATLTTRNITSGYFDAGSVVTLKGSAIIATAGEFSGATLVHQSSGTLSGIELRSMSTLTCVGNPNATAAAGTVIIWSGSRVLDVAPGCIMTYTASYVGPNTISGFPTI